MQTRHSDKDGYPIVARVPKGAGGPATEPCFETIRYDSGNSFQFRRFQHRSFAEEQGWHYHPEFELTWITGSEGTRFVADSIQRYGPNDLVLLGPNIPHYWDNERRGVQGKPEAITVQFKRDCFGSDFLLLPEMAAIRRMLDIATRGVQFAGPVVRCVGDLMKTAVEEDGMSRLTRFLETLNTLASCPNYSILGGADYHHENDIHPANRSRIEFVHRYVRENLGGELRQAEIANKLGLSPSGFSRFFRAATGRTFVNFVNVLRVSEAGRLLSNSWLSVTEIAMACGYQNISNFNRQFLKLTGMNPSEYRQRICRRKAHFLGSSSLGAASNKAAQDDAERFHLFWQSPNNGRCVRRFRDAGI